MDVMLVKTLPPQDNPGVQKVTRKRGQMAAEGGAGAPSIPSIPSFSLIGSQASHDQSHGEHTLPHTHIQHVLSGLTYTQSEMGVDGESGWRVVMTSQMVGRLPALSRPVKGSANQTTAVTTSSLIT